MAESVVLSLLDAVPGRHDELVDWFATKAGVQLLRATNPEGDVPPPEYAALWEGAALVPPAAAGHMSWAFAAIDDQHSTGARPARDIMLVLNNAVPGREAEFDAWYRERHIADTFRVLGFSRARRYRGAEPSPYGFMAIYDVPDGELDQCVKRYARSRAERAEALAAGREPEIPLSPAQGEGRFVHWYRRVLPA
jgi:hypothetical protein